MDHKAAVLKRCSKAALACALIICGITGCARNASLDGNASLDKSTAADSMASPTSGVAAASLQTEQTDDAPVFFEDVAQKAGLIYKWSIPGKRPLDILQGLGHGCAFFDYNSDGKLDVLLVSPRLALFRGNGHGRFVNVTNQAGLDRPTGHFLGCTVGDYDNDGYSDIYVSGYRAGLLLHNRGGKSFQDVTQRAGITPRSWATSCAFADVDGDGKLDLYISNYVQYDSSTKPRYCDFNGVLTACGPLNYKLQRGFLYRNTGSGRFVEMSREWGADRAVGRALGVAFADFDASGHESLAIANDVMPGDLLHNSGAKFKNIGVASGTAFGTNGDVHGGMGIDWGDYNNDGRLDLFVGTFQRQAKCVYRNDGGVFSVKSKGIGLNSSWPYVTFGAKWLDMDNDGWLDLIMANGHVQDNIAKIDKNFTYKQPILLYHNKQGQQFRDVTRQMSRNARRHIVGRGLATGDYDNDGRMDALVVDSEGTPLLLHNQSPATNHWISITLQGTKSNRDAIGALVTVTGNGANAGGIRQLRRCGTDGSYLSASDSRVLVGLGQASSATVEIRWPSGKRARFTGLRRNRFLTINESKGVIRRTVPRP